MYMHTNMCPHESAKNFYSVYLSFSLSFSLSIYIHIIKMSILLLMSCLVFFVSCRFQGIIFFWFLSHFGESPVYVNYVRNNSRHNRSTRSNFVAERSAKIVRRFAEFSSDRVISLDSMDGVSWQFVYVNEWFNSLTTALKRCVYNNCQELQIYKTDQMQRFGNVPTWSFSLFKFITSC